MNDTTSWRNEKFKRNCGVKLQDKLRHVQLKYMLGI